MGPNVEPRDASVLEIEANTVLPGLINLHEHLTMKRTWGPTWRQLDLADPYLIVRGVRGALAALRQGFTTVRELGAKNHLNVYLRRAIDAGLFPGPRVIPAGAPISITGGHAWKLSTEADGPEGMRRQVRETIKAGADWIKLITSNDPVHETYDGEHTHAEFQPEELTAAVTAAHAWKRRVTAHAMGREAIGWALDAGVDSIEHGVYLDDALAERMRSLAIALVPTMSGYHQSRLDRWSRGADWIARHEHLPEDHRRSTRLAIAAGVRIGVGTDTLGDFVEELTMLTTCGMTKNQVLSAATHVNASVLGLNAEIGAIRPGMRADLVVVRGDPLADLEALRSVAWVVRSGVLLRPDEIGMPVADEDSSWNSLGLLSRQD